MCTPSLEIHTDNPFDVIYTLHEAVRLGIFTHYSILESDMPQSQSYNFPNNQKFPGMPISKITLKQNDTMSFRCVTRLLSHLSRLRAVTEPHGFYLEFSRKSNLSPDDSRLLSVKIPSIYISGRYIKHQRYMSQTPWWTGQAGKRKRVGPSSVEENIMEMIFSQSDRCSHNNGIRQSDDEVEKSSHNKVTFYSLGREDRDVRMLGSGRPFLLKLKGICELPRLPSHDLSSMEVEVHNVRFAFPSYAESLKQDGCCHSKSYRAIVYTDHAYPFDYGYRDHKNDGYPCEVDFNSLNEKKQPLHSFGNSLRIPDSYIHCGKSIMVTQRTPIRVAHRRAQLSREKFVHSLSLQFLNEHYAILDITCSAGMYVKEFVHGDHGRTLPNLGTFLGAPCDILQLDVTSVND